MRHRYAHVLQTVFNRPWAIERETLDIMARVVLERVRGEQLTPEEIEARVATAALSNGERIGRQDIGGVAVIPVYGIIAPRMNLMLAFSGGTSLEELGGAIDEALGDPDINAIVLDIDSPGGSVEGLAEFAAYLRDVRAKGGKHIAAIVNYWCASAAYYIAAQCHEILIAPSGMAGAIGTIARHVDQSRAEEAEGITTTLITSDNAPFKAEGNPHEPLSEDAHAEIQRVVNRFGSMFVNDVAKGRGIAASKVTSDFGGGRMLLADEAVAAGMVDGIATLEATVRRLAKRAAPSRSNRAAMSPLNLAAISLEPAVEDDSLLAAVEGNPDAAVEPHEEAHEGDADPADDAIPEHVLAAIAADKRTPAERLAAWGASASRTRSH
jgi:signal peptide peptidase SppA